MVHGCMVYTERAETAAVSCGTSHASVVSTPLRWIVENRAIKNKTNKNTQKNKKTKQSKNKLFTRVESHASAVSLLESGEYRYIKAINNNQQHQRTVIRSCVKVEVDVPSSLSLIVHSYGVCGRQATLKIGKLVFYAQSTGAVISG